MRLYHFTTRDRMPGIVRDGLRTFPLDICPTATAELGEGIKPQRGVWLTENDTLLLTPEERLAHYKSQGDWINQWLFDPTFVARHSLDEQRYKKIVRLTIRIGDHDKRLIKPEGDQMLPHLSRITSAHWCYLRAIPISKVVDFLDCEPARAA